MTEKQAKNLIKIGKILLAIIFAVFFVVIISQSIQISNLSSQYNNLNNEYNQNQSLLEDYNNKIENIEDNFNKYSEEELRKEDYIKENEIFIEFA